MQKEEVMSEEVSKSKELPVAVKEFNEKLAQLLTSASEAELIAVQPADAPVLEAGHTVNNTIIILRS
jgi:hypothetical protein